VEQRQSPPEIQGKKSETVTDPSRIDGAGVVKERK
jgi:hypothetical protein